MSLNEKLQLTMAWVLNVGVILSLGFVIIGGGVLLYQHGLMPVDSMILPSSQITINPMGIWAAPHSAISLIELGLLTLIGTQVVRVLLLAAFYMFIRDVWFTFFSLFILMTLVSSFFYR